MLLTSTASAQLEPRSDPRQTAPGLKLPEATTQPPLPPAPLSPTSAIGSLDPGRYRLDEGDVLLATIEGPRSGQIQLICWSDGCVILPPVGRVRVQGLTVSQAEQRLSRSYARYRRNFRLSLTVAAVRRFQVQVLGAVARPGVYEVDGLTPVFQAIDAAGGIFETGSRRKIAIYADASARVPMGYVDQQAWACRGHRPPDWLFFLKRRQTIVVPDMGPTARVKGQVQRPGRYEFLPGESLQDLIVNAGGLTASAQRGELVLGRLQADGKRQQIHLRETRVEPAQLPLMEGDELEVYDLTLEQPYVGISGELIGKDFFPEEVNSVTGQKEVQRKGMYRIREGETLRQAVLALGGPTIRADLKHVQIEEIGPEKAVVSRTIDLASILNHQAPDVELKGGQTILVPPLPDTIYLVGQFGRPGPIAFQSNLRLREYLSLAGGTTPRAATKHGRVIHLDGPDQAPVITDVDLLSVLEGEESGPLLRPGDVVYAPLYEPLLQEIFQVLSSLFYVSNFSNVLRR